MGLMKTLGFRKADEMDVYIALIAVRTSWAVTMVILLFWSLYSFVDKGAISLAFIPLGLGLAVYFAVIVYLRGKLSDGDQE